MKWVGKNGQECRFFTNKSLYLRNIEDRHIVTMEDY